MTNFSFDMKIIKFILQQSVVSASAEPDTIRLSVNIEANSLSKPRRIKGIESKRVGSKKVSIMLASDGGTVEEEHSENNICCINDNEALMLGTLSVKVSTSQQMFLYFLLQQKRFYLLDSCILWWPPRYRVGNKRWSTFHISVQAHNKPGQFLY